jgi:hypothetical protein
MPPDAPARTRIRRSRGLSFRAEAKIEPNPDPIWAIGPSFPADPPLPIVRAEARIFMSGTRLRICPPQMERFDHRVGPVPFRFGGEVVDDQAGDQSAAPE